MPGGYRFHGFKSDGTQQGLPLGAVQEIELDFFVAGWSEMGVGHDPFMGIIQGVLPGRFFACFSQDKLPLGRQRLKTALENHPLCGQVKIMERVDEGNGVIIGRSELSDIPHRKRYPRAVLNGLPSDFDSSRGEIYSVHRATGLGQGDVVGQKAIAAGQIQNAAVFRDHQVYGFKIYEPSSALDIKRVLPGSLCV